MVLSAQIKLNILKLANNEPDKKGWLHLRTDAIIWKFEVWNYKIFKNHYLATVIIKINPGKNHQ